MGAHKGVVERALLAHNGGPASTELAQILGWQNAVRHGQVMTMHETDWHIWLATGRNEFGATTVSRPAFGPWTVLAALDARPTGADVDAGRLQTGPPILGRTFALTPADAVRSMRVLLEIAPGARPVP